MKIVTCLSWYDEPAEWLEDVVKSVAPFSEHIVAVDGAYARFPDASPDSPAEQSDAIQDAARDAGMGCTIHEPQKVWRGNEVEKRGYMLALAETLTRPNEDFYFIIDGDERVSHGAGSVRKMLAALKTDLANVRIWYDMAESDEQWSGLILFPDMSQPRFFRSIPGIRPVGWHFGMQTPSGRRLWSDPSTHLDAIKVEHRTHLRDHARQVAKAAYYRKLPTLEPCGQVPAHPVSMDPTRVADQLRPATVKRIATAARRPHPFTTL